MVNEWLPGNQSLYLAQARIVCYNDVTTQTSKLILCNYATRNADKTFQLFSSDSVQPYSKLATRAALWKQGGSIPFLLAFFSKQSWKDLKRLVRLKQKTIITL